LIESNAQEPGWRPPPASLRPALAGGTVFAWLQWKQRLVVLWEYYASNFLGFVELASITMLLKRI
jgi:hypothetical protein